MTSYQRGDIALCADGRGGDTNKVVIVQNADYIEGMAGITLCPIISVLSAECD